VNQSFLCSYILVFFLSLAILHQIKDETKHQGKTRRKGGLRNQDPLSLATIGNLHKQQISGHQPAAAAAATMMSEWAP
jgi:hypothetical protein